MTNVGGQIGYIYGAYLWPGSDEPRYVTGFSASAAFALGSIVCAWWMRICLQKENKRIMTSTTDELVNLYAYQLLFKCTLPIIAYHCPETIHRKISILLQSKYNTPLYSFSIYHLCSRHLLGSDQGLRLSYLIVLSTVHEASSESGELYLRRYAND